MARRWRFEARADIATSKGFEKGRLESLPHTGSAG